MTLGASSTKESDLKILILTQGQWGERIAENVKANAPQSWEVNIWSAPLRLPPIIDDPEVFLPEDLPSADLILSLGERAGLAQLVPEVVGITGASAVIAPIDHNEYLPPGLARQLEGWLKEMGVASVFPKPFCSLTENTYNRTPLVRTYDDETIRRFAKHFGKPKFSIDVADDEIEHASVLRDSACGCARSVAENLPGIPIKSALERAGMLHHHFPCLASMKKDPDYLDTLMHVSGNLLIDSVKEELKPHLSMVYLRPRGRSEEND
jgi:hypothetical protein